MLRTRSAATGAFGVILTGACACSSAESSLSSPEASGGVSPGGVSPGGTSNAGTSNAGVANDGGLSFAGTPGGGGRSSMGGQAAGGEDAAAGGASESTATGTRRIFFLDVQGKVLTFDQGTPTPRTLVSAAGPGPDGIAVDSAGGHIFWTTMGVPADDDGSLRRANLDGSNVTTIVPTADTYTPKQLKLDVDGKKLYWSDREGMRVQRAAFDGSEIETLVTVATGDAARQDARNWCVGLALDFAHGFVYWTQKGPDNGMAGSIRRAHLQMPAGETDATRQDIEVLFAGLPEPIDLDLDVAGGYMYWTDRGDDTINRAPVEIPIGKSAATRSDRQILVPGVREAIGLALDLERGHVYFTGGTDGRVGRANLDGSAPHDFFTGTGAFTGIAVVQQAGH